MNAHEVDRHMQRFKDNVIGAMAELPGYAAWRVYLRQRVTDTSMSHDAERKILWDINDRSTISAARALMELGVPPDEVLSVFVLCFER